MPDPTEPAAESDRPAPGLRASRRSAAAVRTLTEPADPSATDSAQVVSPLLPHRTVPEPTAPARRVEPAAPASAPAAALGHEPRPNPALSPPESRPLQQPSPFGVVASPGGADELAPTAPVADSAAPHWRAADPSADPGSGPEPSGSARQVAVSWRGAGYLEVGDPAGADQESADAPSGPGRRVLIMVLILVLLATWYLLLRDPGAESAALAAHTGSAGVARAPGVLPDRLGLAR